MNTTSKPRMIWIAGDELTMEQRKEVLARYTYRHTMEHTPHWVKPRDVPPVATVATDNEWIDSKCFAVTPVRRKLSTQSTRCNPVYLKDCLNRTN